MSPAHAYSVRVDMKGVHKDAFLPPPPTFHVELIGVHKEAFLGPPLAVHVDGFLSPSRTVEMYDIFQPQGEFPLTPTAGQCAEPTISLTSSVSPVPPHAPCC